MDSVKGLIHEGGATSVNFYLNDIDPMTAIRNLLILNVLQTKLEDGIDLAINLWYSAALTDLQSLHLKSGFNNIMLGAAS